MEIRIKTPSISLETVLILKKVIAAGNKFDRYHNPLTQKSFSNLIALGLIERLPAEDYTDEEVARNLARIDYENKVLAEVTAELSALIDEQYKNGGVPAIVDLAASEEFRVKGRRRKEALDNIDRHLRSNEHLQTHRAISHEIFYGVSESGKELLANKTVTVVI